MRLSIVNYGLDIGADIPDHMKREDDELINIAKDIIQKYNFGTGAAVVSEVFHTGLKNSNHRKYMEQGMEQSITSFFSPHATPFLMHHETGGGGLLSSGDPNLLSVGSNIFARYSKRPIETASGPASGYGKVVTFVPSNAEVNGQRAIDALRSRQLLTVSLGARVSDTDYRCSICHKSLYDDECNHNPGKEYDEGVCMAEVYNPFFREYSVVYNPSDIHAAVRRMDVMESENPLDTYHVIDQEPATGYIQIYESIGKPVYPSAPIPAHTTEYQDTQVQQNITRNQQTTAVTASITELVTAYERQLREKDETIATLIQTLKNKMEELATVRSQIQSEEIRSLQNQPNTPAPSVTKTENTTTSSPRELTEQTSNESETPSLNETDNTGESHNTSSANIQKKRQPTIDDLRKIINMNRIGWIPPPR